jgi:hypothetical protein
MTNPQNSTENGTLLPDDIINQVAYYITNEDRMPAGLVQTVIEEIERLENQISKMVPAFLEDIDQGISLGPVTDDHPEDDCEDCQWYNQSVIFASMVESGKFGEHAREQWRKRCG